MTNNEKLEALHTIKTHILKCIKSQDACIQIAKKGFSENKSENACYRDRAKKYQDLLEVSDVILDGKYNKVFNSHGHFDNVKEVDEREQRQLDQLIEDLMNYTSVKNDLYKDLQIVDDEITKLSNV